MRKFLHLALAVLLTASLSFAQGSFPSGTSRSWIVAGQGATFVSTNAAIANAATFVRGAGTITSSGSSATVSLTSVALGDLLVVHVQYSGSEDFSNVTDGTNTFTSLTQTFDGQGDFGVASYQLSAAKSGSVTYTANFSQSVSGIEVVVYEFNAVSGSWHYDASNQNGAALTAASTTGNITTTGTVEAITFGSKISAVGATASNPLINGVTPVEPGFSPVNTYDHYYYYLPTSSFSGGQGALTYNVPTNWVTEITAFDAH